MALLTATFSSTSFSHSFPVNRIELKPENKWRLCFAMKSQDSSSSRNSGRSHRQVWRRRKLVKKDKVRIDRVPFLEEQVRKIRESGELLTMDIERLLLSEDNRFDFVNEVAAEAKQYVENNRDEYGAKKAILHVISNRMNDSGVYRPEAYKEDDPFKPGPGFLRQELYDK
ncbi:protein PLASTID TRANSCRIPTIONALLY ACTIVE 7 isoform X2 [Salvia miltiorrhiza]|uniref:protein PLASTID TRANSCRIPTIONALLY ACTIVE 7 isoform X2 n=1 Tax=Salvia miltiorrhiza TaxID=226208 RepID=UPI0025AC2E10|nr:protein PLASTID TRANSCRIPTIONALLY ACTIVE 7 isoform X2 [Salvia miltiorrhiza]